MPIIPVFRTDLVKRVSNDEPHIFQANSFITFDEAEEVVKFRLDANLWEDVDESTAVRALVMAYRDLNKLIWSNEHGKSQSKDYEFRFEHEPNHPPLDDSEFLHRVKHAQVAQTLYILGGTQVRDMARDGILMTRGLTGSEMEFTGYRGAVCAEAKEHLGIYVEHMPRMRRLK